MAIKFTEKAAPAVAKPAPAKATPPTAATHEAGKVAPKATAKTPAKSDDK